jgi:hypothetical protein
MTTITTLSSLFLKAVVSISFALEALAIRLAPDE